MTYPLSCFFVPEIQGANFGQELNGVCVRDSVVAPKSEYLVEPTCRRVFGAFQFAGLILGNHLHEVLHWCSAQGFLTRMFVQNFCKDFLARVFWPDINTDFLTGIFTQPFLHDFWQGF